MKRVLGLFTVLITVVLGLTIAGPATAAQAANCQGQYQVRGDHWSEKFNTLAPSPLGGALMETLYAHSTAVYRYFPNVNDSGHRSILLTEWRFRVEDIDYNWGLTGFTFRAGATELGTWRDVDVAKKIDDNGKSTQRGVGVLPLKERICMEVDDDPRDGPVVQYTDVNVHYANWPDRMQEFTNDDGVPQKTIHPDSKSTIHYGSWQYTG